MPWPEEMRQAKPGVCGVVVCFGVFLGVLAGGVLNGSNTGRYDRMRMTNFVDIC